MIAFLIFVCARLECVNHVSHSLKYSASISLGIINHPNSFFESQLQAETHLQVHQFSHKTVWYVVAIDCFCSSRSYLWAPIHDLLHDQNSNSCLQISQQFECSHCILQQLYFGSHLYWVPLQILEKKGMQTDACLHLSTSICRCSFVSVRQLDYLSLLSGDKTAAENCPQNCERWTTSLQILNYLKMVSEVLSKSTQLRSSQSLWLCKRGGYCTATKLVMGPCSQWQ